jgi:hypothetical protein
MRRVRTASAPWIGSLLVHGALVGAAMQCRGDRAPPRPDAPPGVDVIEVEATREEPAVDPGGDGSEAGGEPGGGAGLPSPPPPVPVPERRSRVRARAEAPREEDADATRPAAVSSASPRIAARAPVPGAGAGGAAGTGDGITGDGITGSGSGSGSGDGGGRGSGTGPGTGRRGAGARSAPRARMAPPSKARPPLLVYPRRERDERPGEVFIVVLTVDEKGYVVGVRLQRGVNPDRDAKALDAVWRFHYDPALDRAGRPVPSKVVQRFMVE